MRFLSTKPVGAWRNGGARALGAPGAKRPRVGALERGGPSGVGTDYWGLPEHEADLGTHVRRPGVPEHRWGDGSDTSTVDVVRAIEQPRRG
jgi:hypothetical protein